MDDKPQTNENIEYLICPVSMIENEEQKQLDRFVRETEATGVKLHYPTRDVNQKDTTGMRILSEHRVAMHKAVKALMWYDPKSKGSVFDAGMAFMLDKQFEIANYEDFKITNDYERFLMEYALGSLTSKETMRLPDNPAITMYDQSLNESLHDAATGTDRAYYDFLWDYARTRAHPKTSGIFIPQVQEMSAERDRIKKLELVEYTWKLLPKANPIEQWKELFTLGMIFVAEKPLILLNREEVEKQAEPGKKSYQNVLLILDDEYRKQKKA